MTLEATPPQAIIDAVGQRGPPNRKIRPPKAIDLFSGVGGWTLGLKMAGLPVLASYELCPQANKTQRENIGGKVWECDIGRPLPDLPKTIDCVVGSPPCTDFSLSNKGGNGDIVGGLKHIARFLSIVENLQPRFWILENVPRLKSILHSNLYDRKGKLKRFRYLFETEGVHVRDFDMSRFGLPQRRIRCIAGRYPAELLDAYAECCETRTLQLVIDSLSGQTTQDPIYGINQHPSLVTEHELEHPLTAEEVRINRDAKRFHPIYNKMDFPDRLDRPVRAITATCTRVGRESVVIRTGQGGYRRLTLRERACAQGFPITFQFYSRSYIKKLEMIGNAIPPLFVYYIGNALRGIDASDLKHPHEIELAHTRPLEKAPVTPPPKNPKRHRVGRRFRAALPSLRFNSGVRFELANTIDRDTVSWAITFVFGTSTDIRTFRPGARQNRYFDALLKKHRLGAFVNAHTKKILRCPANVSASSLQERWTHTAQGSGPHALVRALNVAARKIAGKLKSRDGTFVMKTLSSVPGLNKARRKNGKIPGYLNPRKFNDNAAALISGLILAAWFNTAAEVKSNRVDRLTERR